MPIRIPILETEKRGDVTRSNGNGLNTDYYIAQALQHATTILSHGKHEILALPATSPHTLEEHSVWWLNSRTSQKHINWNPEAYTQIIEDTIFWDRVQQAISQIQYSDPSIRAYMYIGFFDPDSNSHTTLDTDANLDEALPPVIFKGLQSQERLHLHLAKAPDSSQATKHLSLRSMDQPSNQKEYQKTKGQIARFLNFAGENTLKAYPAITHTLRKYGGSAFTFHQPLLFENGSQNIQSYPRSLYAFSELSSAIKAIEESRISLLKHWLSIAVSLHEFGSYYYLGEVFNVFQSCIPNWTVILPTKKDKKIAGRSYASNSKENEVWVSPLAVIGAPESLTEHGLLLQRNHAHP